MTPSGVYWDMDTQRGQAKRQQDVDNDALVECSDVECLIDFRIGEKFLDRLSVPTVEPVPHATDIYGITETAEYQIPKRH